MRVLKCLVLSLLLVVVPISATAQEDSVVELASELSFSLGLPVEDAVVAILSTVGFVSYTGYITDSRDSVEMEALGILIDHQGFLSWSGAGTDHLEDGGDMAASGYMVRYPGKVDSNFSAGVGENDSGYFVRFPSGFGRQLTAGDGETDSSYFVRYPSGFGRQ